MTPAGRAAPTSTLTVLIVDDHEMVADSLSRVLSAKRDIAVVGRASTAAEAVHLAGVLRPAVVIVDYHLPDGDGVTVGRAIRELLPTVQIVLLTGSGGAASLVAAQRAGFAAYLEKTRAARDLADIVRRVHAGETVMPDGGQLQLPTLDQLRLHYQPVIDLSTSRIVGFEALLRWDHPQRGVLLPREFLELAEQTDLIFDIGRWVLVEATRQVAAWRRRHPRSPALLMSVNLSARQLHTPDLLESVASALARSGLRDGLVVEITETVLLDVSDEVVATLTGLRALGVQIALDDFGTGYSSLAYLRRLPIDVIKLDKVFTGDLPDGARSLLLAETITTLARELEATTVAEGIETAEQAACLRRLGPMLGQGFHFHPPLPAAEVAALLAREPA